MVFHSPQITLVEPVVIRFGKKKIKLESCVKFLGLLLDVNLSSKYHIAELSKQLSRTIGFFIKYDNLFLLKYLKSCIIHCSILLFPVE